ncbi:MAG: translation initiation factor IF-2, partial [Tissierellia bacterium]|nr:translation initiation factor IF-2 [Tissierellia bacterium]
PETLKPRPAVVTVMGHVDHGKTSLLDAIKQTSVTEREAGGITQHIGAYTVNVNDKKVVFLDTPGHEAFTSMRARGAQITDIAILVVAADDGVMPQTIEAIAHAKAANVPIIVAINKMDKPDADVDRIKQGLVENGLMPEDWGGDTITVPVSAKNKEGIDELLEMILLVAEIQEFKANPNRNAIGTIVEAQLDKGKGPLATVLVQKGTLKVGDMVVSGLASGRIRAMIDDKGKRVKKAGPSIPVVILGLSEVPNAGELLYVVKDEKEARSQANKRRDIMREQQMKQTSKVSLDDLYEKIALGEIKDLNIIVKGDVRGSIEALTQSLAKLDTDEVKINTIHGGVGGITETDIMLASASNAIVIGFNVRPNLSAIEIAKNESVDIRTYRVIYEAIEDIQAAVKGMHAPKIVEEVLGRARVRATFRLPNNHTIAGIYVMSGKITRNAKVRLLRDDVVIFEGAISSLKRFKDDAREVQTGYEAGLGIDGYNDLKEGDMLEAYILKEVER